MVVVVTRVVVVVIFFVVVILGRAGVAKAEQTKPTRRQRNSGNRISDNFGCI